VEVDDHRNLHVAVPPTSGEFEEEVTVATTTSSVGYCARCQSARPPRCHHCSICQRFFGGTNIPRLLDVGERLLVSQRSDKLLCFDLEIRYFEE
ncbi:hypothetical protein RYX36_025518, partial [Vicia faba]